MKNILLRFLLICLAIGGSQSLYAQYDIPENKVWVFSAYTGIDFNGPLPQTINTSMCRVCNPTGSEPYAPGASVCDTSGKLLFYTDGSIVWDSTGQKMPHANSLGAAKHVYQVTNVADGAIITSVPDNAGKYYVFSLTGADNSNPGPGKLYYSVIDMQLNNGLGDAVPDRSWIPIDTGLTPKMTAVPGDNCNVWLIAHDKYSNTFKAYEITWKGINLNPVLSATGNAAGDPEDGWSLGQLSISPDRKKLVSSYGEFTELYDFDPATGKVSNGWIVDSSGNSRDIRGACFSSDNSKLYTTHLCAPGYPCNIVGCNIYQFDLSQGSHAAIRYAQTIVSQYITFGELRLAPDKKIYFIPIEVTPFAIVNIGSPNIAGSGCMAGAGPALFGPRFDGSDQFMGNDFVKTIPNPHSDSFSTKSLDTCLSGSSYTLYAPKGDFISYKWNDSTADTQRVITKPGTYWVTSIDRCQNRRTDTFVIKPLPTFSLGNDTLVCALPISLKADVADASYLWSNGSSSDSISVYNSGTYWLQASKGACVYTDSIHVTYIDVHQDLGKDQSVCREDLIEVHLNAHLPTGTDATVLWSTGSTTPDVVVKDTGIYWVSVQAQQCMGSDTLHIVGEKCTCHFVIPTAFSPNGDSKNDLFHLVIEPNCPVQSYQINIYNRWGQKVYTGNDYTKGWDGTTNGTPQDIGTYQYIVEFSTGTESNHYYQKGAVTLVR